MTDTTLLPCPFCGGEAVADHEPTRRMIFIVFCRQCGASIDDSRVGTDEVLGAWNRRAALPAEGLAAPTTAEIESDHPVNSGRHDAYELAMQLVGERCQKAELVALVTHLLLRAERAAATISARGGWQPIDTAPKDGTPIIVGVISEGELFEVDHGRLEVVAEDEDDGPWDIRDGEPWCSYYGRPAGTYFNYWLPGKEWESHYLVTSDFPYTHWTFPPPPPLEPK